MVLYNLNPAVALIFFLLFVAVYIIPVYIGRLL